MLFIIAAKLSSSGPHVGALRSGVLVPLDTMAWDRPLELYRPFLSYNELGAMFDEGPSAFHDRLSKMLGLEDLVDGQKSLARERLARTKLRLLLVETTPVAREERGEAKLPLGTAGSGPERQTMVF